MPKHKHADLMLEYAQDAQETETPWDRWEIEVDGEWINCSITTKMFDQFTNYRRKQKLIIINGIEVPEPMRVAPHIGTDYFYVRLNGKDTFDNQTSWDDSAFDKRMLSRGICHLTEDAARKHTEALLSFTKVQE